MKMKIFSVLSVGLILASIMAIARGQETANEAQPIEVVKKIEIEVIEPQPIEEVVEEEVEETVEEFKAPYSNIPLEADYQMYIEEACRICDVDFWIVMALIESESTFNHDAVGDSGRSIGLMQINQCWHEYMADEYGLDVNDHEDNVKIGMIILNELMDKYPPVVAIQCYKAGEYRGIELYNEGKILPQAVKVLERAEEMKNEALSRN